VVKLRNKSEIMGNHVSILLVATGARLVASTTGPLIQNLGASAFSSSSEHDQSSCADEAARYGTRLDGYDTCWCASGSDCARDGEWLAVNLGANYNIFEVATKGCGGWDEHIRSYKLQYYFNDQWLWYNSGEMLTGNSDSNPTQEVRNALNGDNGIVASQLKIVPMDQKTHCSTNIEAYGAPTPPPTKAPTDAPTDNPTTITPTKAPTDLPTTTKSPTTTTALPTSSPSAKPSVSPTDKPTEPPSAAPTDRPTATDAPTEADNEQQVDENEEDDQGEDEDGDSLNSNADEDEAPASDSGGSSFLGSTGISNVELLILATSMVVVCLLCTVGVCVVMRMDRAKKAKEEEVFGEEDDAYGNPAE